MPELGIEPRFCSCAGKRTPVAPLAYHFCQYILFYICSGFRSVGYHQPQQSHTQVFSFARVEGALFHKLSLWEWTSGGTHLSYRSKRHCGASLLFIVKEVALVNPELPATHPLANTLHRPFYACWLTEPHQGYSQTEQLAKPVDDDKGFSA